MLLASQGSLKFQFITRRQHAMREHKFRFPATGQPADLLAIFPPTRFLSRDGSLAARAITAEATTASFPSHPLPRRAADFRPVDFNGTAHDCPAHRSQNEPT
jgi:hypothetical protein